MKNNNHKKMAFQDNFIKRRCRSARNHPSGWSWWKRKVRKATRRILNRRVNDGKTD